jgi:hypothetical protein
MNIVNIIIGVFGALVVLGILAFIFFKRIPRRLKTDKFAKEWKQLQAYCKDKKTWPDALSEADKLLDTALKKRKFKGKSMGERMVSAQRAISNNDAMWFGHNLYKKITAEPKSRLSEADMKAALVGFRGALKDIGALESPKPQTDEAEKTETKA